MTETPHILVIDDDVVYAEVLGRSLQRRGMQALVANNLSQAMELAAQYLPHYAVLDLKLEQESGLEAIAPLLAINPDMNILVLTGYSSIATAVSAIKQGALDYAPKPLDADAVLHKLGIAGDITTEIAAVPEQPPSVDRMEWEHIQRVLAEHDNNISATARSLGMHRRTLQRKLQKRPVRN